MFTPTFTCAVLPPAPPTKGMLDRVCVADKHFFGCEILISYMTNVSARNAAPSDNLKQDWRMEPVESESTRSSLWLWKKGGNRRETRRSETLMSFSVAYIGKLYKEREGGGGGGTVLCDLIRSQNYRTVSEFVSACHCSCIFAHCKTPRVRNLRIVG